MLRVLVAAVACTLCLASGAHAVTINQGETYEGVYSASISDLVPASCCSIVSVDSPLTFQQFGINFSSDLLDTGEKADLALFEGGFSSSGPDATGSVQNNSAGSVVSAGVGGSSTGFEVISGVVRVTATTGSFDLSSLIIQVVADATVNAIGGGTLATQLPGYVNVTGFSLVSDTADGVVPLPAAFPLLLAALGGLFGLSRLKRL